MYNSMYYNGYNPYMIPGHTTASKGLLNSIGKINWGNILNNTQKTLNVINQAIPVYYQMKPIYNNAKTMLRLIGSLNSKSDTDNNTSNNRTIINRGPDTSNEKNISNRPIFFS